MRAYVSVSAEKRQRVERHSNAYTVVSQWGKYGKENGEFDMPTGIAIGENHLIYVSDCLNHRIQCFQRDGQFVCGWGSAGDGNGKFSQPKGLSIGTVDQPNESVLKALCGVTQLRSFPPGLLPICVAYVGVECIVVVDSCNHRLQMFEMDGKFVRTWGNEGQGDGQLKYPECCAICPDNVVCVADTYNHRIQCFRNDGTFITQWGTEGGNDRQFRWPMGIFVSMTDKHGWLISIADSGNDRITDYKVDGKNVTWVRSFLMETSDSHIRYRPYDVIVDRSTYNRNLFMCDHLQNCVLEYSTRDDLFCSATVIAHGLFDGPWAMAKSTTDILYVSDSGNNRIIGLQYSPQR